MVRHVVFFLAVTVSFLMICDNPNDPFSDYRNAFGILTVNSETGEWIDSVFYDSTGSTISIKATIFLTEFIDSGTVQVCYKDSICEPFFDSLFSKHSVDEHRIDSTAIPFKRGGRVVVRITTFIQGGFTKSDSVVLLL